MALFLLPTLLVIGLSAFPAAVNGEICQRNWSYFNGNCYLVVPPAIAQVSPLEARTKCLLKKADLVSIGSEAEDFFVRGLIAKADTGRDDTLHRYAIGMQLKRDELGAVKSAEWNDNSPLTFGNPTENPIGTHPWGTGAAWSGQAEPKANNANANCVAMLRSRRTNGDWAATPCAGITGGFICKYVAEKAGAADSSNANNKQAFNDKEGETTVCVNGYVKFGRNCYKAFDSQVTIAATAELACQADGGHLATINSEEEDLFVKGLVNHLNPGHDGKNVLHRYFIGMQLERESDGTITNAKWKNGDTLQYGDPTAQGFLRGTGPWGTGHDWNGQAEPKQHKDANVVFLVKNSLTAGEWAAGPSTLTGGYVCQIKGVTDSKRKRVI